MLQTFTHSQRRQGPSKFKLFHSCFGTWCLAGLRWLLICISWSILNKQRFLYSLNYVQWLVHSNDKPAFSLRVDICPSKLISSGNFDLIIQYVGLCVKFYFKFFFISNSALNAKINFIFYI